MFTCFIHSWYSLTDQCPRCSRTGGSSDSTELIINPTPEGVTAEAVLRKWREKWDKGGNLSILDYSLRAMHEYASLVSASDKKEIARLKEEIRIILKAVADGDSLYEKIKEWS